MAMTPGSASELSARTAVRAGGSDELSDEEFVIWREDLEARDYVRQVTYNSNTRRRKPAYPLPGQGRLVGYTTLKPEALSGEPGFRFRRRLFWVASWDRSEDPNGTYRVTARGEAVDPRTVQPGFRGRITERAWGMPLKRHLPPGLEGESGG